MPVSGIRSAHSRNSYRDLNVNLVYFHTIKPIDKELIERFRHTEILVIHDAFGLYEAICEVPNINAGVHNMGDLFCCWYGMLDNIREKVGLDVVSIRELVRKVKPEKTF